MRHDSWITTNDKSTIATEKYRDLIDLRCAKRIITWAPAVWAHFKVDEEIDHAYTEGGVQQISITGESACWHAANETSSLLKLRGW